MVSLFSFKRTRQDKRDIPKELIEWADIFSYIDFFLRNGIISFHKKDLNYFRFLRALGKSIYHLNRLIVEYFQVIKDEDLKNYLKHNNDLLTANVKHFFFKEEPCLNLNFPSLKLDYSILLNGKFAFDSLKSENIEDFKFFISKFYYLLTLVYSFLYIKDEKIGIFLRFDYDRAQFERIKNLINQEKSYLLEEQRKEEFLRNFTKNIFVVLVKYYLALEPLRKYATQNELEELPPKDIYKEFCNAALRCPEPIVMEPFTWRLACLLWQIDGFIQDRPEYIDKDEKTKDDEKIINEISKFIGNYLHLSEKAYSKNRIEFDEFFDLESRLVNFIRNEILYILESKKLNDKIQQINEESLNLNELEVIEIEKNFLYTDFKGELQFSDGSSEEKFKITRLFETLSSKAFVSMLLAYCHFIYKKAGLEKNKEIGLIGFYTSGVFIAHLLNILYQLNKPVWMFKMFPYIATHPLHEDRGTSVSDILILDECIKTGFTFSCYETYITRELDIDKDRIKLYPLFDFTYYKKIIDSKYSPFIKLKRKNLENTNIIIDKINKTKIDKNIKLQINKFDTSKMHSLFDLCKCEEDDKKIDFYPLLTDSNFMWYIAYKFKSQIDALLKEKETNTTFIFSPSPEGKVLALLTSFLLKIDGRKVKLKYPNEHTPNNENSKIIKIAIDLSIDTGYTLASQWCAEKGVPFRVEKVNDILEEFDMVFTIFKRDKETKKLVINPIVS